MSDFYLKVIGCGDAFHSHGRNHTAFYIHTPHENILIDCGMTTLKELQLQGINTDQIDVIIFSHLHGDHFGGLPLLILQMVKIQKRTKTLHIVSPPGLEQKLYDLLAIMYPGTESILNEIDIDYISYRPEERVIMAHFQLMAFPVLHTDNVECYGIKLDVGGKTIAYSGDTAWTDQLYVIAEDADLFLCECNHKDQEIEGHLNWQLLSQKSTGFACKKLLLTHMNAEMIDFAERENIPICKEGMTIEL